VYDGTVSWKGVPIAMLGNVGVPLG